MSSGVELEITHSLVSGDTYGGPGTPNRREGEGRGEERVGGLVRREVVHRRALPADHPGDLGTGTVDEARLADAPGEQLLQIAEALGDLVHPPAAGPDLVQPGARRRIERGEGGVVRREEGERTRTLEVVGENAGLLLRRVRQPGVERRPRLASLAHRCAHAGGQEAEAEQQSGSGDTANAQHAEILSGDFRVIVPVTIGRRRGKS